MPQFLTGNHTQGIGLSVIVPLYNEEDSVNLLYEKIVAAIQPLGLKFEIIFVDDGSRDNTVSVATLIATRDNRLRIT